MTQPKTLMELFEVEERDAVAARQIKGTKPAVKDVRKPKCPVHMQDMEYEAAIGRWKCPEAGCQFTATRKVKDEDGVAPKPAVRQLAPPRKSTPVYGGDDRVVLTVTADPDTGEDQFILTGYAGGDEFSIDVSGHVETVIDDQTNSVTLCLLFHDVQRK